MSIVFSKSGLGDIKPPCVVQSFVNHNARLFKVFIVGRRRYIIQRPSIKNLTAGGDVLMFQLRFLSAGIQSFYFLYDYVSVVFYMLKYSIVSFFPSVLSPSHS